MYSHITISYVTLTCSHKHFICLDLCCWDSLLSDTKASILQLERLMIVILNYCTWSLQSVKCLFCRNNAQILKKQEKWSARWSICSPTESSEINLNYARGHCLAFLEWASWENLGVYFSEFEHCKKGLDQLTQESSEYSVIWCLSYIFRTTQWRSLHLHIFRIQTLLVQEFTSSSLGRKPI